MKRRFCLFILIIVICVSCGACNSWMNGEYLSVTPRNAKPETYANRVIEVTSYTQLRNALANLVRNGAEDGIISISAFNKGTIHFYVDTAISNVIENTPFGAYAIDKITYEIGTNRGVSVVACKIHYRSGYQQPSQIERIGDAEELNSVVEKALEGFDPQVLVLMEQYEKFDAQEIVNAYAARYPDKIVEIPEIEINIYPDKGAERIIEILFQYDLDQVQLQQARMKIEERFRLAEQQVQGLDDPVDIYEQLYLFLTSQYQYADTRSSEPSYDLLVNGRGDDRAFAETYTRLCIRLGLGCNTVIGTRNGQNWCWNAIQIHGKYYYIDILKFAETNDFHILSGSELEEYEAG